MYTVYSRLTSELQKIVKEHKIEIMNNERIFAQNSDMVFVFLMKNCNRFEVQSAIQNLQHDPRFVQKGTKSGRNSAGDAVGAYAIDRYFKLLYANGRPIDDDEVEDTHQEKLPESKKTDTDTNTNTKIRVTSHQFFSNANKMPVSGKHLTDEAMAVTYATNLCIK